MKSSLEISNFLEDISSLSHSIFFLYFFALITEEGFLFSPCYSFELYIQISFLFSFPLASLLFSTICKVSLNNHFVFLHFFFLRMVLITASCTMLWTSAHSSSGTLSDLILWIHLSFLMYNHKGFDLGHTWMIAMRQLQISWLIPEWLPWDSCKYQWLIHWGMKSKAVAGVW